MDEIMTRKVKQYKTKCLMQNAWDKLEIGELY